MLSQNVSQPLFNEIESRENLREYIHHFNKLVLKVPSATSKILVSVFSQRLVEGDFFWSLAKKLPDNYDDLMGWAKKIYQHGRSLMHQEIETRFITTRDKPTGKKPPPLISHHAPPQPFPNYESNKRLVKRAVQVLEGERRQRLSRDVMKPPPLVPRSFCVFH